MRYLLLCTAAVVAVAAIESKAATLPRFPPNAVWNRDISAPPLKHPNSDNMINHLSGLGGWGTGATAFQIDFSFFVLHANAGIATTSVMPFGDIADNYYYPDCGDFHMMPSYGPEPLPIPLPPGGGIEGTGQLDPTDPAGITPPDYNCDNANNDCHMLIVQGHTLFESGNATLTGGKIESMCALTWDLDKVYPPQGRGDQCTSVDAAGYPVAPLLFNADEIYAAEQVANGDLGHAIRFILLNSRMKKGAYVHPASHATSGTGEHGASDTNANAVPYGSRFRLKASFNVDAFVANNVADGGAAATTATRVILRTLQKYGMFLSDGGSVPLTAESDWYTTHKWTELGMDPFTQSGSHALFGIAVTDFEVVVAGDPIALTYDCNVNGNHLTPDDFIFIDGYDY
jgi:serine/threonine-protein kinase